LSDAIPFTIFRDLGTKNEINFSHF
jgi:hypothetical protein